MHGMILLENDTLVIGKEDVRKALDDVAKAVQEKIKTEIDYQKKQSEEIKLDMIKRKQDDLRSLESKTAEGVKTLDNLINDGAKKIKDECDDSVNAIESITNKGLDRIQQEADASVKTFTRLAEEEATKIKEESKNVVNVIESSTNTGLGRIKQETDTLMDSIDAKAKSTIEESVETLRIQSCNEQESITELGKSEKSKLVELGDTLQKTFYTRSIYDKEEQYITSSKKLKDELIAWYNTTQSTVPLSPLTDDPHTHLAEFYIMPEIDIHTYLPGGRKETTRVKSLQDLFTSGRKVPREIYLSAVAGFGKTAFSKYLAITWCQAHKKDENYNHFKEEELKALSGFGFLFLVLLRDSAKVCDIDEMIEQQVIQYLPCSSSMPKLLLKDILRDEKCLVILDGLDEWLHPDNDCTRLPKSIPHRYAREKCVILTTTRPWKLGVSNLKTNQIDKSVELVKMDRHNAKQFNLNAMKILKGNIEEEKLINEVCRFEEVIRNHNLDDMESTPLLLLYLICLWAADIPIGNSAVELYTGIIQLLLTRTEKLHRKFHSSCNTSPSNVPECFRTHQHFCSYYTFLLTIGKLAFYTLFSKKKEHTLVFDKNVAEIYLNEEDLKLSCLSGILSESKVTTLLNETCKISFSHKSVQEYFSAIFISFQNKSEVQKIIFEKCNILQNILDMSKVFVFISNMNPKLMSTISSDLMPVVNNDEKINKYRTMTEYSDMYIEPLQDTQDMYISCAKESQENTDLKLCLQDFIIDDKCQQENYLKQLQHLYQQNKENIKSIIIENEGICSLQEIINLFTLSDLPQIEKLYYRGEIEEEKIMSLLLAPLKCLTVLSQKWENHFVGKRCRLSAEINGRLVKLQHLQCLYMACFTMTHEVMETLLNFLTSRKLMKEISLDRLYCSDHDTSCRGLNLDLSQHSQLRCLGLNLIPVSQLNMDVSLLEECTVGKLFKPGVVLSYLSQLQAASKLQRFESSYLESSIDIETMLKTIPLLHHVKEFVLYRVNLGERTLTLSQMINIERVDLLYITMSCLALHDLITVIHKLPHSVTVCMKGCDIKPETEFENYKTFIKYSDNFVVTDDGNLKYGVYMFEFKTTSTE